ncbi:MAG: tyrosine-protein phosphatase [Myxococcota bacterium]|nr:CpsB/CapC family capsule biosynthesis tyrosine phosphatase [Myxococcota bacterium]
MLDLHCHILPGIDDGAPDVGAALDIARAMVALGYEQIAPSPHTGGGVGGDVSTDLNETTRQMLTRALAEASIPLTLVANAEHCVGPILFDRLPKGATCIGGESRWLLVELPWERIPQPEQLLFRLQTKGYRLLLAHPERYSYLDVDTVERLVERGVRMQVELGSFVDVYGDRARGRAEKMVEKGLVHVLASDIHRPKQALEWLGPALAAVRDTYGEGALRRATHENPNAILKDVTATALEPMTTS